MKESWGVILERPELFFKMELSTGIQVTRRQENIVTVKRLVVYKQP